MNAAIFWLDIVLLALAAGNTPGAEADDVPSPKVVSTPFLLNRAGL